VSSLRQPGCTANAWSRRTAGAYRQAVPYPWSREPLPSGARLPDHSHRAGPPGQLERGSNPRCPTLSFSTLGDMRFALVDSFPILRYNSVHVNLVPVVVAIGSAAQSSLPGSISMPPNKSKYIFGMHDPGGEYLMAEAGRRGWVLFVHALGHDPGRCPGFDYSPQANQGFAVMARLNHGYEPNGTIPRSESHGAFAECCAQWARKSRGGRESREAAISGLSETR